MQSIAIDSSADRATAAHDGNAVVPWQASLRTRVMLWFGALVGTLLLVVFGVAYLIAQRQIIAGAQARTRYEAAQAAQQLNASMSSVHITGTGVSGLLDTLALDRDAVARVMEAMLAADASAVGGLVVLEPGVLPDGGPMAYYAGVAQRGVADRDLAAEGYDWRAQDWYQRTLLSATPWWSEPYFNETAGGRWMSTLNIPLRGRDGSRRGMVSLDVPVTRWDQLIAPLEGVAGQLPALFAPAGTVALHPDPGVALRNSLSRLIDAGGRRDLAPMEAAHAAGRRLEFTHTLPTGETRFSVLEPIGNTGWSLQLALSHEVILADLRRTAALLGLGLALALLVAALLVRRVARRITVPLSDLTNSAGHFAAGEFEYPLGHVERRDEVGVMARAFDNARGSIKRQIHEIAQMSAARQRLESELDIARDIQLAMLPPGRALAVDGVRLDAQAQLEPAKAVGGDFYTFFELPVGTLWFVIGDVSDKGVPAALFMARAVTVLETAARLHGRPDAALVEASHRLVEGNDTCMFATVLCGVVDVATGALVLASAGHEAPVRLRADGHREFLPVASGPPLGFEPIAAFETWHGRLDHGDVLLAYTDGISEAFDHANQPFGTERLLAELDAGDDALALCARLVAAVHRHADGAPQSDDITVLALRREGG